MNIVDPLQDWKRNRNLNYMRKRNITHKQLMEIIVAMPVDKLVEHFDQVCDGIYHSSQRPNINNQNQNNGKSKNQKSES